MNLWIFLSKSNIFAWKSAGSDKIFVDYTPREKLTLAPMKTEAVTAPFTAVNGENTV